MNILWLKQFLPVQTFKITCGVLLGLLAMQATAKPALATVGDKSILLMPSANPYALSANSGIATVRFSVQVVGKNKLPATVYLRRRDDKKNIAMNDHGKDGDLVARDGIYGVNVQIDTAKVKADSCLVYEALTQQERGNLKSPPLKLCVSSFPIGIAPVNISNPARWGDDTRAAADEVLITVAPEINATTIRKLARSINANVAGSILPLNFYQLKLPAPANQDQLLAYVLKLRETPGVTSASVNLLGQGALNVNDAAFDLAPSDVNSQHGLKLVLGHIPPADANPVNAWDGNNRGAGKKVVVMDTGLDLTNPDLPDTWTCQLIPALPAPPMDPTVESPCTASIVGTTVARHGTLVAGVIAASATIGGAEGSGEGIAGVAFNSTIHSMKMNGFDLANQTQAFNQAVVYRGEHADALVYNASFNVLNAFAPVADVTALCGAINSLVLSGSTARAIVVNSAGNNNSNGLSYPGRCNDPHTGGSTGTDALSALGKPLLITVANSVSFLTNDCGNGVGPLSNNCGTGVVGAQACIDQLCRANIAGGTPNLGSNYGAWVDIAAPGSKIRSTTIVGTGDGGGNYVSETGTTMSAPFVSGAAAILLSCGVPISGVENVLKTSAIVTVPFPDGTSAKRLDIKLATASCNQPPETNAGSGSGLEDAASIAVTLSGSDVGGSVASFQFTSLPANGVLFSDAGLTVAIPVSGTVVAMANTATVYFVPAHNFNGSTTFNYTSIDNLGMADATPATVTINVTPVNDAPVNTVPAAQTAAEGIAKVISGISVFDADAGALAISMTLTATHGTISVNTGALGGVPAANITGNNTASIMLTGSQSQINATLADAIGVTYTASLSGGATLTVMSYDNGASGGPAQSDTDVININVAAVNHPPTATNMSAPQSYTEDVSLNLTGIVVTDPDVGDVITATLTLANPAAGMLSSGGVNSVGGVWTTSGSVASVNALLVGLVFAPSANFNSNFSITTSVSDGIAPAITGSKMMTGIPVSDIPTYAVGIDGTRTKGFTLNAIIIGLVNPDGWSATGYQWRRSDTPPPGDIPQPILINGNGSSYILVDADVGKYMSVCVTYTSGVLTPVTICSGTDATATGDPHINTVDGLHYDFQSAGEFVALRGSDGMEIQVRQTPVSTAAPLADNYSMLPVGVSVNTAVAARVGTYHVTYQMKDNTNAVSSGLELKVEHTVVTPTADGLDLGSGGRVASAPGNGIQIDFPDGTTMVATPYWWTWNNVWYMDVSVMHTSAYNGLMGARYKGSWLPRLSDGSALGAMPTAMHERYIELYVKFADSWRVNDDTTLFDYVPGTSTKTFTFKEWPKENGPYVIGNGPVAKPLARNIATQLCRGVVGKNEKADCVFDVMVTGNRGIAKSHLLSQQIRTGLTSITVRDDRRISKDKEMVTFTATVARHVALTRMALDRKGGALTGEVQFTINGNSVGKPVKLNARGQAQLQLPRLKFEKQMIGARYIPVKGSVFFPSSSIESARLLRVVK